MSDFGPANAIAGDDNFGTELPQTEVQERSLEQEKKFAKFAKSPEFKEFKAHLESRIEFYQTYMPDGRPVITVNAQDRDSAWLAANIVIGEFKAVLSAYEQAADVLKDNARRTDA